MPYKDKEKQNAAVAAAMRRRYWKDPEASRAAQNAAKFERRYRRAVKSGLRLVALAAKLAKKDEYGIARLE